jgi:hypothetical protein
MENVTSQQPIRIGTREREAACRSLDEHLAEGRLDMDEYADRYAKATVARLQSELDELFLDLPLPHAAASRPVPEVAPPARERSEWTPRRLFPVVRIAALVLAVCVATPFIAAWFVLWFVLPMVVCGGHHRRSAWRHGWHGPNRWANQSSGWVRPDWQRGWVRS